MSFRRRRTPLACTLCRKRKRRCDAQKPTCGTCQELEAECIYDEPSLESIRLHPETDMQGSLNRIEDLLQTNSAQIATLVDTMQRNNYMPASPSFEPSFSGHTSLATDASVSPGTFTSNSTHNEGLFPQAVHPIGVLSEHELLPPLTIPEKHSTSSNHLLLNPAIREMIGQYPSDYFLRLESKNEIPMPAKLRSPDAVGYLDLERTTTDGLVISFFQKVHCYHPLLDRVEFDVMYNNLFSAGSTPSSESCLCLVVFALGATVLEPTVISPFAGMPYMHKLLPDLLFASTWNFSWDIKIVQALILASIYFSYLARPLYSWRLINMAAAHTHFLLPRLESSNCSPSQIEQISRCFWSCFMIESDRLAELEVPQSSLQKLVDHMPLPSFRNSLDSLETTYYLAEISLRRLFNRIHNVIYPKITNLNGEGAGVFTRDQLTKLFTVCDELHSQLDTWQKSIPEPFRPDITDSRHPIHDRERVLGIRYFAALHIIYRPFVLHIVASDKTGLSNSIADAPFLDVILEKCRICLESCHIYIHRATEMLKKMSPYTWTFSISSLGAALVLTMAVHSARLHDLVPDIDEMQSLVIEHVEPWAVKLKTEERQDSESSLEAAVDILKEIRRKRRIRNFFD